MKKLFVTLVLMVLSLSVYAEPVSGGMWYFGAAGFYGPQADLNQRLASLGYNNMPELGIGMVWGGGGIVKNFYFGGWGYSDFGGVEAANTSAGKTLRADMGGRGGADFGYVVFHNDVITLIPTVSMIWGGRGFSFTTNMTFDQYIANPVDYSPSFGFNEFSFGAGLKTLLHVSQGFGLNLNVTYLYTLTPTLGNVSFSDAPVINNHSVVASLGIFFGGMDEKNVHKHDAGRVENQQ